jgi:predicted metalloprotease with PDZ domain
LFIHALIGGDHLTGSALGFSKSQDGLVGAFGGGVEWSVSNHLAVRSSVDYVFTRHNIFGSSSYTQNNVRAGAGLVYTFGGRGQVAEKSPRSETGRDASRASRSGLSVPALGLVARARNAEGAEISEVASGSIAEQSGLRVGDVINAIDGKAVRTPMELQVELSNRAPGAKIRLGVLVRGYYQSEIVIILR